MKFEDKISKLRLDKYKGIETPEFLQDVKKLADGEPLEYVLGKVIFAGASVDLSLRAMIPRPEAEFWLTQAIKEEIGKEPARALDLFSGSGCLGIALAKNIQKLEVDCIELNPKLKEQIEISAKLNGVEYRVHAMTGSIWEGAIGNYDIITAVPPYVPPHMKEEVMQELHAEDPSYFFDKEDGFYFHKEVLSKAKDYLSEGGALYLEFDMTQRERIEELAKEYGWMNYSFLKDPYGHESVIRLTK